MCDCMVDEGQSMAAYELMVCESDLRASMEVGHDWLDMMPDETREKASRILVDKATSGTSHTDFYWWFIKTSYYDDMWESVLMAIDEYIDMVKDDVLKEMEG